MQRSDINLLLKEVNVLFVDDEEFVVDTMKEILSLLFKNTYFAYNGLEGLNLAKENKIDLVITDLSMPIMNGIKMIKEILKIQSDVKVICVSGHNESEVYQGALEIGAAFVIKPINTNALYKAFEEVLM